MTKSRVRMDLSNLNVRGVDQKIKVRGKTRHKAILINHSLNNKPQADNFIQMRSGASLHKC